MPGSGHADKERLLAQVVDMLEELVRTGSYAVSPEWFTLDLTMAQVRGVFFLMQKGPQRMNTFASTLAISFSRATALADQLVEKGLVSRWTDQEDRRSVLCALTEKGKELAYRLLAERRSRWGERLAALPVEELEQVCQALEVAYKAVRRAEPVSESVAAASDDD